MIQLTKRIYQNNQLVGYVATDNNQSIMLNKLEAWMKARNNQISNVCATGNPDNPTLSGTNGFELKKLPQLSLDKAQKELYNYTTSDAQAAVIRVALRTGIIPNENFQQHMMNCVRNEITTGAVDIKSVTKLSNHIKLVNILYYKDARHAAIGYRIKYDGPQPLTIKRLTLDGETSEVVLNTNDEINLSTKAMSLLMARPEFGCEMFDGKWRYRGNKNSKPIRSVYDLLLSYGFYFDFDTETTTAAHMAKFRKDICKVATVEEINTYFTPQIMEDIKTENKKVQHRTADVNELIMKRAEKRRAAMAETNLFDAFKR